MGEYFQKVAKQITEFALGLSTARKIAVLATAGAVAVGMVMLFMWAGDTSYVPLMNGLNGEDSANIIRILRDKRIPFKVDPTGKNISIPSESVYDLRLELATMGLPQSSVVGYEVFDKQSLGQTSYVQKINQKRALEGELTRTISTIKGVKRARVHLAMPQKSTFVEDQKKSTASVVVDLEPGTQLNDKQVYGIGNLVARAVEGMEVGDVAIVDSNGKTLSKTANDPLSAATATQLDFQQKVESDIERRVEAMLSRVVGEGKVVAKVTADLDFSQTNETQTTYDQDGAAIRSTEKRNDSANGTRPAPGGVAGAQANLPNAPEPARPEIKTDTSKVQEFTNFEVPQTVRRTTKAAGGIKRLSVAVVLDGKTVKTTDKEGKVLSKTEAWSEEKLKEFSDVVASAVGIDRKRGDTLEIKNMEFSHEDFEEIQRALAEKERKQYIQNLIVYAVIGITIGLFFFFVVRPFIKWVTENTIDSVDTFLPQTIEELERMQKNAVLPGLEEVVPVLPEKIDPEKVEGDMLKEKIFTLVDANPHKAALILRDWLAEQKTIVGAEKPEKGGGGKDKTA